MVFSYILSLTKRRETSKRRKTMICRKTSKMRKTTKRKETSKKKTSESTSGQCTNMCTLSWAHTHKQTHTFTARPHVTTSKVFLPCCRLYMYMYIYLYIFTLSSFYHICFIFNHLYMGSSMQTVYNATKMLASLTPN